MVVVDFELVDAAHWEWVWCERRVHWVVLTAQSRLMSLKLCAR